MPKRELTANPVRYSWSLSWVRILAAVTVTLLVGIPAGLLAQRGPGGVSNESTSLTQNGTCRIWLDASEITSYADNEEVPTWNEVDPSLATINDKAFRQSSDDFLAPYYRDDAAYTINGHPVLTFEQGRMYKINSSDDLNTSTTTTYTQTMFVAFRTSSHVSSRQIIWEEGGIGRGFNIFIYDGKLYMGAYDNHEEDDDVGSGQVPAFGYSYIDTPIEQNTTYVISFVFNAPTDNTITTNSNALRGFKNGAEFTSGFQSTSYSGPGVGGVYQHPNPIGVGGINGENVNTAGVFDNATGMFSFKGRLAELCYYNENLNEAERIIVENYLGAKYYANIIINDKYAFQTSYGSDVIGIGKDASGDEHNNSQGKNPFRLEKPTNYPSSTNDRFLLTGHDGSSLTWTDANIPNNPSNTRRLNRIWRFDESGGDVGEVRFWLDDSRLPDISGLPAGFNKYVLIVDDQSENFPNFTQNGTKVLEIEYGPTGEPYIDLQGTNYTFDLDNAFFTIGVVKPAVSFSQPGFYAIEQNPAPPAFAVTNTIQAELNYTPGFGDTLTTDYNYADGSAINPDDYQVNGNTYVTFGYNSGQNFEYINTLEIVNDLIAEASSTENLTITLDPTGPNSTPGTSLGAIPTATFTIYDDDPTPEINFASATTSGVLEGDEDGSGDADSLLTIEVIRTGGTSSSASCEVQIDNNFTPTATPGVDFDFNTQTVYFAPGETQKFVTVGVGDDNIDEADESFRLRIQNISGASPGENLTNKVTIVDDDNPPTVQFLTPSSSNFESVGNPQIYVKLSQPSALDVTVNFNINTAAGTANNPNDYTGVTDGSGSIVIPPGDTIQSLTAVSSNFLVTYDGTDPNNLEPNETVVLELDEPPINASLASQTQHTYTIIDYSPFENTGVAGVGQLSDYSIWVYPDQYSQGDGQNPPAALTNNTPRDIDIVQNNSSKRGKIDIIPGEFNGRKLIKFDGANDNYKVEDAPSINETAPYRKKSMFFVIKAPNNIGPASGGIQVLYEEGGTGRGFSVYLIDNDLYFNGWNNNAGDPVTPWGSGSSSGPLKASAYDLTAGEAYIISCHYQASYTVNGETTDGKMRIFLNGVEMDSETDNRIKEMFAHGGDIGLGNVVGTTQEHSLDDRIDDDEGGYPFSGWLAEFLYLNEPDMNSARRKLIENYLSAKYNIPLDQNQFFDLNFADRGSSPYFGENVAGIGRDSQNALHNNSQGQSILRISHPATIADESYMMWGHNNEVLDQTWPYSSANLPATINDRSGKVWKIFKGGNIDSVQVRIRFQALNDPASYQPEDLKLLVHNNSDPQDFSNTAIYPSDGTIYGGYVAEFNNVSFQDGAYFTLGNTNSVTPLPIELLTFDARLNSTNSTVDLNWATATETHNDYFVVERAGKDLRFKKVLEKPGAGSTIHAQYYSAVDGQPLTGINYYRLKQVDYDGDATYSDVKSVYVPGGTISDDIFLYPNPYQTGELNIRYPRAYSKGKKTIRILSAAGKVLYRKTYTSESNLITIHPGDLADGLYVVSFRNKQVGVNNKLIVK